MTCPITGTAEVQRTHVATPDQDELYWLRADPEVHVSGELLAKIDPDGKAFLLGRYEVGEPCPHQTDVFHARLREDA